LVLAGCTPAPPGGARDSDPLAGEPPRLPTGVTLDPDGTLHEVGQFPLAMVPSPEGDRLVLLLNGHNDQGLQVVDRATGRVLQTELQPAAFLGLVFSPDGRTLYASGGNQDVVYRYHWAAGRVTLRDSVVLAVKVAKKSGTSYPAGLATSPDGRYLYVAENLSDQVAVVTASDGRIVQRLPAGRYPYGVVVSPDGAVYLSAWGASHVTAYTPAAGGRLVVSREIPVGRHPSAMILNRTGTRLFVVSGSTDRVTVVDPHTGQRVAELLDPAPAGPGQGSTPNAIALSDDGTRLYVAEADNNAVAVFDLGPRTADVATATGTDQLAGRIPAGWYPTAVLARGDTLLILNAKGRGSRANAAEGPGPERSGARPAESTLAQIRSTLQISTRARTPAAALASLSDRVARANNWGRTRSAFRYPPIEHVVYIIKENRTYDQVLSDLPQGDGDTTLLFFPRAVSPNHHALAERFGLFHRFFVNAEVSPDGHNWSMAAYTTDYLQKTVPSNYSDRGRSYDYEGTNRGRPLGPGEDDVAEPANGYLWNLVQQRGLTFKNFGEFVMPEGVGDRDPAPVGYRGLKPFLEEHTDSLFPGYDLKIPDQVRADRYLTVLGEWSATGVMPAFQIIRLPNDHTMGARAGELSPRAYMADNDLALGRIIEGLSRSSFWRTTAVFVLEDDAQDGPDHVDSHRSVLLVVSPYARTGTVHRFVNTTDVVATMEEILGLGSLSQFDYYGRPLREIWTDRPDLTPYPALMPAQSLADRNPPNGPGARESEGLDFTFEDIADEETFNRALWLALKGPAVPFPGTTRMSGLELRRSAASLPPR